MCGVRTFPPVLRQIPDNGALDVDPTEIEFLSQWIAHSGARVHLRPTCPRKTNADSPFCMGSSAFAIKFYEESALKDSRADTRSKSCAEMGTAIRRVRKNLPTFRPQLGFRWEWNAKFAGFLLTTARERFKATDTRNAETPDQLAPSMYRGPFRTMPWRLISRSILAR